MKTTPEHPFRPQVFPDDTPVPGTAYHFDPVVMLRWLEKNGGVLNVFDVVFPGDLRLASLSWNPRHRTLTYARWDHPLLTGLTVTLDQWVVFNPSVNPPIKVFTPEEMVRRGAIPVRGGPHLLILTARYDQARAIAGHFGFTRWKFVQDETVLLGVGQGSPILVDRETSPRHPRIGAVYDEIRARQLQIWPFGWELMR